MQNTTNTLDCWLSVLLFEYKAAASTLLATHATQAVANSCVNAHR